MERRLLPVEIVLKEFDPGGEPLTFPFPFRGSACGPCVQRLDLLPYRTNDRPAVAVDVGDHDETFGKLFLV